MPFLQFPKQHAQQSLRHYFMQTRVDPSLSLFQPEPWHKKLPTI
jgi:hypothetical protein